MNDEIKRANSHTNEENISKIIFIGESDIVRQNIASGAPNARKAHPKNSATVMISVKYLYFFH